ncbi:MAG TPA: RNA polymerase sigma factor [Polyangiaceae bacterium]|nr:RNA polymerase sigma factor [Polyangiaceae bacterium]
MSEPRLSDQPSRAFADELRTKLPGLLPALNARALALCKKQSDASDLVQDTVLRALCFESGYEQGTNLRGWLQQILFSVFITRCRKVSRERRALGALASDPCAWTNPDAPPVRQSLLRPVSRALEALPSQFSAVVRLVDLEERSYKDAATELAVPVGTVMSRLFRGRRLLAEALAEPAEVPAAA